MPAATLSSHLDLYDYHYNRERGNRLFSYILVPTACFFIASGMYLKTIKAPPPEPDTRKMEMIRAQFMIQEKKKPAPVLPRVVAPVKKEAIDLTKKTVLNQSVNDIVEKKEPDANVTRRVFGLRKVYSIGLGAATGASSVTDAVIGKLGNTLNKDIDTLTATEKDLKGKLVSVTAVTAMPAIKVPVKPEYTEEMKKNGVSGTIAAKILVDVDGTVRDIVIMNDLGFGSREAALKAFKKLVFTPALQGKTPVAVWIVMKFKFVLQE